MINLYQNLFVFLLFWVMEKNCNFNLKKCVNKISKIVKMGRIFSIYRGFKTCIKVSRFQSYPF